MTSSPNQPVVIVTGASRGLGAAIARCLDSVGCRLVLVARSREPLEELAGQCRQAIALAIDLGRPEAATKVVDETMRAFGRLDALVNNAGLLGPLARLEDADMSQWSQTINVNLVAAASLIQKCLPQLRQQRGRIVNVSTGAALKPMIGWSAYCASKAGFLHLTSVVAAEAPEVTSVSLRPGVIDTEMQREIREEGGAGMDDEVHRSFIDKKENGQLEPPEVPGRAAAWLALHAPPEFSGEFIQYTDDRIAGKALELFGSSVAS